MNPLPLNKSKFPMVRITGLSLLFLGLVAAIVVARSNEKQRNAEHAACVRNLKMLFGPKEYWMLEGVRRPTDIYSLAEIVGAGEYIKTMPICPQGGQYWLGPSRPYPEVKSVKPQCTILAHSMVASPSVIIMDEAGKPISGASVSLTSSNATIGPWRTDRYGQFQLDQVRLPDVQWLEGFNLVITKQGYGTETLSWSPAAMQDKPAPQVMLKKNPN